MVVVVKVHGHCNTVDKESVYTHIYSSNVEVCFYTQYAYYSHHVQWPTYFRVSFSQSYLHFKQVHSSVCVRLLEYHGHFWLGERLVLASSCNTLEKVVDCEFNWFTTREGGRLRPCHCTRTPRKRERERERERERVRVCVRVCVCVCV